MIALYRICMQHKYWTSFFCVLTILFIIKSFCPIGFLSNDDMGIMMIVNGGVTGTPSENTVFTNVLWGLFLSSLYKLNANIPWYIMSYGLLILLSLTIVCRYCLEICSNDKNERLENRLYYGLVVFFALYITLFCYSSVLLQFTTMSAFCGLSAILLMQLYPVENPKACLSFFVMLLFADIIRPEVGYLTTLALLMMFGAMQIIDGKTSKKYPIVALLTQGVVYGINYFHYNTSEWTLFNRYSAARAAWNDYPHVSFEKARQIYEQVGWNKELYNCVEDWFFMDRHVTTEAFEKINEAGKGLGSNNFTIDFMNVFSMISGATAQIRVAFVLLILTMLVALVYNLRQGNYRYTIVSGVMLLVPYGLFAFLGSIGRLPYRVAFSIVILFILPYCLHIYTVFWREHSVSKKHWLKGISVFLKILVISSLLFHKGIAHRTYLESNSIKKNDVIQTFNMLDNYIMRHPSNIYILDNSLADDDRAFLVYPEKKPYNRIFWGGWYMYSPGYYEQLKANGLDELYAENFLAENVFICGRKEPSETLLEYMAAKFPDSSVEIVDEQDEFVVYKFYCAAE